MSTDESQKNAGALPPILGKTFGMPSENDRKALRKFMRDRELKPYPWAQRAGVREGTLRAFLTGQTQSMKMDTLEKLARAESTTVEEMLGRRHGTRAGEEFVAIQSLDVKAAAGGGIEIVTETAGEPLHFRKSWLESVIGRKTAVLRVIGFAGDSMRPTINDGDVGLVNVGVDTPARDEKVYCLWDGVGLLVKRLQVLPGRPLRLRIVSDNPQYPPYETLAEDVRIIGEVIWRGGRI